MILINPKGKEINLSEARGNKILSMTVKQRQGWKIKEENEVVENEKTVEDKIEKPKVRKPRTKKVNG